MKVETTTEETLLLPNLNDDEEEEGGGGQSCHKQAMATTRPVYSSCCSSSSTSSSSPPSCSFISSPSKIAVVAKTIDAMVQNKYRQIHESRTLSIDTTSCPLSRSIATTKRTISSTSSSTRSAGAVKTKWDNSIFCSNGYSWPHCCPFLDTTGNRKSICMGLIMLSFLGILMGIIMPKNQVLSTPSYRYISSMIGYTYFIFWCFSFYPQVISNHLRKSVQGLSVDFTVINFVGYVCYAIYTSLLYWNADIQKMYQERHHMQQDYYEKEDNVDNDADTSIRNGNGGAAKITVQSNDVAFALHAVVLSGIWIYQLYYYGSLSFWHGKSCLSPTFVVLICSILSLIGIYGFLVWKVSSTAVTYENDGMILMDWFMKRLNWLDFLYFLSLVKVFITLLKYIPQVVLNARRRSCAGWNIWNIILDIAGAILSLVQLIGDAIDLDDYSSISGNFAKLGLSIISIGFDITFLLQHYIWYPAGKYQQVSPEEGEVDLEL